MFKFMLPTFESFSPPKQENEVLPTPPTQPSPQDDKYLTAEDIIVSNITKRVTEITKRKYPDAEQLLAHYFVDKMKDIAYEILDYMSTEDLYEEDISDETIEEFCEQELIGFAEVKADYYSEDDKCYYVDAWKTNDDSEEGKVIARVYENKIVFVFDGINRYLDVMRVIKECKDNF